MNWSFIQSLISYGALGAFFLWMLKVYVKKLTDNHFNKNIVNHQHELNKALKIVEFNHQRKMEDFILFTNKKHQVYPELYKWIYQAVTKINDATSLGGRSNPKFQSSNLNTKLLKEILEDEGLHQEEIEMVIQEWNINNEDGIKEAQRIYEFKKLTKAIEFRKQAHTFFSESGLYLSEILTDEIENIFDILDSMSVDEYMSLKYPDLKYGHEKWEKHVKNKKKINDALKIVKKIMKDELTVGDYIYPS
ncbi:hypothetical protein MOF34_06825 [Bacillus sp. T17B1]|uniref:hypothetical protein n=1 Tax=Bacillus sp. T17B1 TaxID=2918911 RepID=UPI00227F6F6A|nr:hypothetical protein [Bacillus sp. T17B1]